MRKLLGILLTTMLSASLVWGCSDENNNTNDILSNETEDSSSNHSNNNNNNDSNKNDSSNNNSSDNNNSDENSTEETTTVDFSSTDEDMFTNRDSKTEYDDSGSINITLNGNSATASSNSVKISGSTITITKEGTYIISGTLNNGMIIVDTPEDAKLQLVFNGVSITSSTSAPLYILEADKVFVTLADGTENTLANGGSFTAIDDNNIDGAVFSKQDLTFNGSGSLTITSPAGHGIVCKDDLVITSGTYNITSSSDGINANDSIRLADATVTINAGSDGIQADNEDDATLGFMYISSGTYNITSAGDGMCTSYYIQIENGNFNITTTGTNSDNSSNSNTSSSAKGIKAESSIQINNGTFKITSSDDGVHSNQNITVNGGSFTITTDDDGFHADENLDITAGTVDITKSYEGLEALNVNVSGGDITITASDDGINAGGGTDSSGMGGMFGGGDKFGKGHSNRGPMGGTPDGTQGGAHGGSATGSSSASITISGGNITIYSGGDGLDANGSLTISDGYIYVVNPKSGDTSVIDSDIDPVINGGTFISTGITTMMAQTFSSSSTQGVIACTTGTQAAGQTITIADSAGNEVISYKTEYKTVLIIVSSPDIVKGETYTISIGESSGTVTAN